MFKLIKANLSLFEGEGGGEGSATGESANADLSNVVYGSGEAQDGEEAAEETGAADQDQEETSQPTPEERRKAFKELINGEYKDLYTEDTQKIINKRFKQSQETQQAMQERLDSQQNILDMLNQRYRVQDGDLEALTNAIENDDMYWENMADELGMSTNQAKEWTKMERQNKALMAAQHQAEEDAAVQQQLADWYGQAEALKETFPEFDLQAECQDENFLKMLQSGVPVEHAYKVQHMDDIMQGVMLSTKATTEKRVADNIRARGTRPTENGTSSKSGFVTKNDVSKLTKADRAEIAKRALKGANITFG